MSSQQYNRKTVKLTQEESAVLFGLKGWTLTSKDIPKKAGGTWHKEFEVIEFNDSTLEAQNILAGYGLGLYDKADDFGGVFRYTIGPKGTLEKEVIKSKSGWTQQQKDQRNEDDRGLGTRQTVNWDEVNRKREERDKKFDVKHDESMQRFDDLIFIIKGQGDITTHNTEAIDNLTKEVANLCRQIQNLLGQQK